MVMNSLARGRSAMDVLRWPWRREIVLSCLRSADAVVFPSRATQEAMGPHLGHGRWREIPYGLTGEWFTRPREESAAPGVPLLKKHPETFIVGYAGAMLPHKGPHLLLQAVRRLGWTRTRVRLAGAAGDQSYWSLLQREAEGLDVKFVGQVPAERMPEFLRGLDVLAMTSVWPENLPFVVLEAQATGVPVVGSLLAGVADQIGDERLLFEPGSVEGLAAALEHVARHREEVRPGRVSTAEEMTERTEAVYVEAVGRTAARG
jgi:glycosyltransferase involved in cell wall biosynthesis